MVLDRETNDMDASIELLEYRLKQAKRSAVMFSLIGLLIMAAGGIVAILVTNQPNIDLDEITIETLPAFILINNFIILAVLAAGFLTVICFVLYAKYDHEVSYYCFMIYMKKKIEKVDINGNIEEKQN